MLPKVIQFTQMKMLPEGLYGATQDEMPLLTLNERRKYLKRVWPRYVQADKEGRGALLTEMEQVTGMHRKSITRLMKSAHCGSLDRQKRSTVRPPTYGKEVRAVVSVVWEALDYVCAERLQPQLLCTARHLARFGELDKVGVTLTPHLEEQLATISRATVQRMTGKLRSLGTGGVPLPRRGPQQANRRNSATKGVPMGRIPWQTQEAGHFEVDLVHHCGGTTAGEYAHTLQMIDGATGWSERVAVLGRGQGAMQEGFTRIKERVPFAIKELHPDNGPEFFSPEPAEGPHGTFLGRGANRVELEPEQAIPQERQQVGRAEERYAGPSIPGAREAGYPQAGRGPQ